MAHDPLRDGFPFFDRSKRNRAQATVPFELLGGQLPGPFGGWFVMRGLDRERHQARLALAEQGLTAYAIGKAQGVSEKAILDWAKRHDLTLARKQERSDAVLIKRMSRLIGGQSVALALSSEGLRQESMERWCKRHGVGMQDRPFAGLSETQREDVVTLVVKGDYPLSEAVAMVQRPRVKMACRPGRVAA